MAQSKDLSAVYIAGIVDRFKIIVTKPSIRLSPTSQAILFEIHFNNLLFCHVISNF